jgi:DmsE family decaheme c-type cytochrome
MNCSKSIIALTFWVAALALPTWAHAGDMPALPEMGGPAIDRSAQDALRSDAICTKCHDETEDKPILAIYQTRHGVRADGRTPTCQSCHGVSDGHVRNPDHSSTRPVPDVIFGNSHKVALASSPDVQNEACLGCHASGERANWPGSEHQNHDLACTSCHQVHIASDPILDKVTQPEVCETCHKTQRAEMRRISTHPVAAGEMGCSDCHNAHGSTGPALLVKNSLNETCYMCHADKRGPFLWEHSPVADNCGNCHSPHGSTNMAMLKQRSPWLCQDCHSGDHGSSVSSGANLADGDATTTNGLLPSASLNPRAQMNARGCVNCHVLVLGSNHPAGAKLQR